MLYNLCSRCNLPEIGFDLSGYKSYACAVCGTDVVFSYKHYFIGNTINGKLVSFGSFHFMTEMDENYKKFLIEKGWSVGTVMERGFAWTFEEYQDVEVSLIWKNLGVDIVLESPNGNLRIPASVHAFEFAKHIYDREEVCGMIVCEQLPYDEYYKMMKELGVFPVPVDDDDNDLPF